jgi:hypothetical protein
MKYIQPLYEHDCDACTYMYSCDTEDGKVDVYRTCSGSFKPISIRYSSKGSDYQTCTEEFLASICV